MLNHLYGDKIELIEVWNRQDVSDKWNEAINIIAKKTLLYLKEYVADQNVTQCAKKEACCKQFKDEYAKSLSNIV